MLIFYIPQSLQHNSM